MVLATIRTNPATYEWFANEWVHLVVVDPLTRELRRFRNGEFVPWKPLVPEVPVARDLGRRIETEVGNLPVLRLEGGAR